MKQIWPTYAYSPTTNVLTLTGLNIDRDQLLLVTAADRGRIMYNFADSSVTASAFTSGANTALTLVATTAGLTTTAALVIYFDDQATSSTVTGTVELGPTSLNALESITVTMGQVTVTGGLTDVQLRASAVTVGGTVTVGNSLAISSLPALAAGTAQIGSVTASISGTVPVSGTFFQGTQPVSLATLPALVAGTAQIGSVTASISGTVTANVTTKSFVDGLIAFAADETPILVEVAAGTNRIGVVTIGAGTVTLGAGTAQIGSVTISSIPNVKIQGFNGGGGGQYIDIGVTEQGAVAVVLESQLPAGTAQIGSVTASISNSVTIGSLPVISGTVTANTFALQGTAVTTSNFTSTTASTVLASFNATRQVLTIFNEGAGNLHICAGATCTTIAYQVRLSAGDYYEVPNHQTTITHSAVFSTAGTARICEVS